jgi:hypothetical protein
MFILDDRSFRAGHTDCSEANEYVEMDFRSVGKCAFGSVEAEEEVEALLMKRGNERKKSSLNNDLSYNAATGSGVGGGLDIYA